MARARKCLLGLPICCGAAALECGATGTALAGHVVASAHSVHFDSGVSAVASPPHSTDRLTAISR